MLAFGIIINILAVLINMGIGMYSGFTPVTFVCIAINVVCILWLASLAAIY